MATILEQSALHLRQTISDTEDVPLDAEPLNADFVDTAAQQDTLRGLVRLAELELLARGQISLTLTPRMLKYAIVRRS
jgi:hypothetical protein